jgi:hypothetical protein
MVHWILNKKFKPQYEQCLSGWEEVPKSRKDKSTKKPKKEEDWGAAGDAKKPEAVDAKDSGEDETISAAGAKKKTKKASKVRDHVVFEL